MTQPPADPARGPEGAYAEAGVSIEAADKAIELMKGWVEKARRPEVIGGLGGFAGLFDASRADPLPRGRCWPPPPTASAPRSAIAQAMDVHDTIGFDLVGMVVDDLVVCGAEPLFMTDYIATGRVVPERIAAIVKGIAEACVRRRLRPGRRRDRRAPRPARARRVRRRRRRPPAWSRPTSCSGPARVRPGDAVIAMEASGLHSNGYSLVRHVLLQRRPGWTLDRDVPELGRTLGEELLEPTRIYAKACLDLAGRTAHPRDVARHRRRARGQPGAGDAGRARAPPSTAAPGRRSRSSTSYAGWATSRRPTSRPP